MPGKTSHSCNAPKRLSYSQLLFRLDVAAAPNVVENEVALCERLAQKKMTVAAHRIFLAAHYGHSGLLRLCLQPS